MRNPGLTEGPIEAHLAAVAAALRGPRRARAAVVDELRDGLHDAAAAHRTRGLPPAAAVRAALDEFGSPDCVAGAFAAELAAAHVRRTVVAYLATGPVVGLGWLLVMAPPRWWERGPVALWESIPALPLIAAGCAVGLLALLAAGRGSRWWRPAPQRLLDLTVLLCAACVAGDLLVLAVLGRGVAPPGPAGGLAIVAAATSVGRIACSAAVLTRCREVRRALTV